jgi:hypothetical protein
MGAARPPLSSTRRFLVVCCGASTDGAVRCSGAAGLKMADMAVAWPLAQSNVACVIAGVTKPHHVPANAAAAEITLSAELLHQIDEATAPLKQAMGPNCDLWQGGTSGRIK